MNKSFKFRNSFALRLSLLVITAVIVIFLAVLSYNYHIAEKIILENNEENVQGIISTVALKANNVLLPIKEISESIASVLEYTHPTEKELENLLQITVQNNKDIYACMIAYEPYMLDKDKKYSFFYCYNAGNEDVSSWSTYINTEFDYTKRQWYSTAVTLKIGTFSEPYNDYRNQTRLVTYSLPFYRTIEGQRKLCGVIAVDISLDHLHDTFSKLSIFSSGLAYLLSPKGTFIVHRNQTFYNSGTNILNLNENYSYQLNSEIKEKVLKGGIGKIMYFSRTLNREIIAYYQSLESSGWILCVIIPIKELYSRLNSTIIKLLVIGIAGYIITFILIFFICTKAVSPLKKLASVASFIGKGDFYAQLPKVKHNDEIGMLNKSFALMQFNLVKYMNNLISTTAANEKIERELEIAREIQQNFLPSDFKVTENIELYARLISAKQIGGDLYDFFMPDKDNVFIAIGDVSGKGIPAALFMFMTKTLFRAKTQISFDPGKIISSMNKDICSDNKTGNFITFFLGLLNLSTGIMKYCNAGHNFPIIFNSVSQKYIILDNGTPLPPLGLLEEANYRTHQTVLESNDLILLYTDGIVEAENSENKVFTKEKLIELLKNTSSRDPKLIIDEILSAVSLHSQGNEQSDDITALILKYSG